MGKLVWLWGGRKRLRTRRGKVAAAITVIFIVAVAAPQHQPAGAVLGLVSMSPLVWWLVWFLPALGGRLLWIADGGHVDAWRDLVEGATPSWAEIGAPWQPTGDRKQLREDPNADVFTDCGGILRRERLWFIATGTPPISLDPVVWETQKEQQGDTPQQLAAHRDRAYWLYSNVFYWTNYCDYDAEDVKALAFAREEPHRERLRRAHAAMKAAHSPAIEAPRRRKRIPTEVKRAVFDRDEGACVYCGAKFDIHYDHIIPFAKGGSDTVDNLQILCRQCNQQKGASI